MKLLTMKQVCDKCGFSRTHINRFRHDSDYAHVRFPKPVVIGVKVLFSEDELDVWIHFQLVNR